jgi:DNA replication protein DnaC
MSSLAPTTSSPELPAQLLKLGLRHLAQALPDFLARATKSRWSPQTTLEELCRLEAHDRARRSLERRLKRARLGRFKPIADFDFSWPKKIDRPLIERALTLDFVRDHRNLVLIAANGLGKTMIAKNVASLAVCAGFSVLFLTAAELIADLSSASPETRRRRLAFYARHDLLCLDEVGYLSYDDRAADLLFEVVNRRHEKKALLVTTNLAFKDWNTVFPNATCLTALLDRLVHHADITVIDGKSYRLFESEREAQARRTRDSS